MCRVYSKTICKVNENLSNCLVLSLKPSFGYFYENTYPMALDACTMNVKTEQRFRYKQTGGAGLVLVRCTCSHEGLLAFLPIPSSRDLLTQNKTVIKPLISECFDYL